MGAQLLGVRGMRLQLLHEVREEADRIGGNPLREGDLGFPRFPGNLFRPRIRLPFRIDFGSRLRSRVLECGVVDLEGNRTFGFLADG
jgi:hypothetical protein